MKHISIHTASLFLALFASVAGATEEVSGQYMLTENFAAEGSIKPSLNNRLTTNYAPTWTSGNFDFRLEQYVENSFHGVGDVLVRERKFEAQLNFNYPLSKELNLTFGILRHENSTFRDNYDWAISGLGWTGDVVTNTNLTTGILIEKRTSGGRPFFDVSGTIEHRIHEKIGVFFSAHFYENFGESDIAPTRKREYETGVNYYMNQRYVLGVSYFNHQQADDPTDRFSFIKVKAGMNF